MVTRISGMDKGKFQWDDYHAVMEDCMYEDFDYADDRSMFADPYGRSALRRSSRSNPRNLPCPTCKAPNRLTPADRRARYQCDSCADRAERGGY